MRATRSSGNVFADLGLPHADELKRIAGECAKLPDGAEQFRIRAKALRR